MCVLPEPASRSPSQWPVTARSSASAGRSRIDVASLIVPGPGPSSLHASTVGRGARTAGGAQPLLQHAARLDEEAPVDRLVRHLHPRIIREFLPKPARDLLRRPVLGQLLRHLGPKPWALRQHARLWTPRSGPGRIVRVTGPVPLPAPVAGDLAAHGRGRSATPRGDRTQRVPGRETAGDLRPVRTRRVMLRPGPITRRVTAASTDRPEHRARLLAERLGDLRQRLAFAPAAQELVALIRAPSSISSPCDASHLSWGSSDPKRWLQ
jgi:hypothetical protein